MALMEPLLIVVPEVPVKRLSQVSPILEGGEVDALMFDTAPEAFHEDIVMVAALAVHADPDAMMLENIGEGFTGELDTLIRVEDFRRSMTLQGLLQSINAEVSVQGVRDAPGQHLASVPVHDGHQVHEAPGQRRIRDIGGPHLVGPVDPAPFEQVGINLCPSPGMLVLGRGYTACRPMVRISRWTRLRFT